MLRSQAKIAVIANTAWYIANFRLSLMRVLKHSGHDVVAVSPAGEGVDSINEAGFIHLPFPLSGSSIHPFNEWASVTALRRLLRSEKICLALSYTPKGNIYTAMARRGIRCSQIANVSGLGSSFIRQNWLTLVVRWLYRYSFQHVDWLFFQNEDDRQLFIDSGIVDRQLTECIFGSGVDLQRFAYSSLADRTSSDEFVFLMIARLLADKGVREYVEAARQIVADRPGIRCQLLGMSGADNPTAIPADELHAWVREGVVDYLGFTNDVRPYIRNATCVVLPSYREGMSRTLLEGAAMGRPVIATDVAGCREAVDPGINGFLCRVRDSESLVTAMYRMAELPIDRLIQMGQASRAKMEANFSEDVVLERYLVAINRLLSVAGWQRS